MTMSVPNQLTNFGTCWSTPNGQDLSSPSTMASGNQVIIEALLRRWTTSQGQLIDDPSYGQSIWDLVSAGLSPRDIAYYQQRFAAEAQKDTRVLRCTVTITINVAGDVTLSATVVTANGPFPLVVNVNGVTLQLLLVQP